MALRASYDRKMVSSSALMQLFRALKAEGTLGEAALGVITGMTRVRVRVAWECVNRAMS